MKGLRRIIIRIINGTEPGRKGLKRNMGPVFEATLIMRFNDQKVLWKSEWLFSEGNGEI